MTTVPNNHPASILAQANAINKLKQLLTWQFAVIAAKKTGVTPTVHLQLTVGNNIGNLWLPADDLTVALHELAETTGNMLENAGVDLEPIRQEFEAIAERLQAV